MVPDDFPRLHLANWRLIQLGFEIDLPSGCLSNEVEVFLGEKGFSQ